MARKPRLGPVQRTKVGRMLCAGHRKSGAPPIYTSGCEACEAAKAAGIVRPDAATIAPLRRGRQARRRKWIDWDKVRSARAARTELTPDQRRKQDAQRAADVERWLAEHRRTS